jgi:hypothetical protein
MAFREFFFKKKIKKKNYENEFWPLAPKGYGGGSATPNGPKMYIYIYKRGFWPTGQNLFSYIYFTFFHGGVLATPSQPRGPLSLLLGENGGG